MDGAAVKRRGLRIVVSGMIAADPFQGGASWAVPATAGKYAANITPAAAGAITAMSLSSKSIGVIWTGTDDGTISTTSDGGKTWRNVTPASIKPWTRIFNIEAGHFDPLVAYAAANTLRLDEIHPHFYRTRDGGKTWTEINTGIDDDAVSNTIREDPKQKGLLYAGTDTQAPAIKARMAVERLSAPVTTK